MSRLDDELRAAFRRVEPSSDFAERVIGRINSPPATKPSLWQRLKSFLEPPVARWVAVGVATSLLVAVFASQFRQLQEAAPEHQAAPGIAVHQPPEIRTDETAPLPEKRIAPPVEQRRVTRRTTLNRNLLARQRKERRHKREAEQAKEQLFFALQIASSTLNDANKMVRGDD